MDIDYDKMTMDIEARFKSSNGIEPDRALLKKWEWEEIKHLLEYLGGRWPWMDE